MKYEDKDDAWEDMLVRLNDAVRHEFDTDTARGPTYPTLHVVGLPRSGTTLLMQHLAVSGRLGYPSNIMAMYWKAPWIGARIQKHLSSNASTSFRSLAGRTPEPLDPHEFGYFWRKALGHDSNALTPTSDPSPVGELRRQLDLVSEAFGAPTVYKNFLAPIHFEYLQKVGNQRYIIITRPLEHIAASILLTRRRLRIAKNAWLGPSPREPLPAFQTELDMVAYQAATLQHELDTSKISTCPNTTSLTYAELCAEPSSALQRVFHELRLDPIDAIKPPPFPVRYPLDALDRGEATLLMKYLDSRQREAADA